MSVPDEVWVTDAVALDGSHVALRFSDGHCGVLDMSPYMDDGVFKRLRDPNVFRTARAGVSTVEWITALSTLPPRQLMHMPCRSACNCLMLMDPGCFRLPGFCPFEHVWRFPPDENTPRVLPHPWGIA